MGEEDTQKPLEVSAPTDVSTKDSAVEAIKQATVAATGEDVSIADLASSAFGQGSDKVKTTLGAATQSAEESATPFVAAGLGNGTATVYDPSTGAYAKPSTGEAFVVDPALQPPAPAATATATADNGGEWETVTGKSTSTAPSATADGPIDLLADLVASKEAEPTVEEEGAKASTGVSLEAPKEAEASLSADTPPDAAAAVAAEDLPDGAMNVTEKEMTRLLEDEALAAAMSAGTDASPGECKPSVPMCLAVAGGVAAVVVAFVLGKAIVRPKKSTKESE